MLNVTEGGAVETHRMYPDSRDDFEEGRLGYKAKWEYFRAVYERYRKAGREAKHLMLNEFCLNTGYHRKYAIRLLNGPPPGKQPERRPRGRRPRYGQQLLSILAAIEPTFRALLHRRLAHTHSGRGQVNSRSLLVQGTVCALVRTATNYPGAMDQFAAKLYRE